MSVDFTQGLSPYKETGTFRFWCQKVLPLVYDDSLSYYELLCKVVNYLNDVISNVDGIRTDTEALRTAFIELQDYVNNYFDNLDVQDEINAKLDGMATDGTLSDLITPYIPDAISDWLEENLSPTTPPVDNTLSIAGAAADAKKTGDEITKLKNEFNTIATIPENITLLDTVIQSSGTGTIPTNIEGLNAGDIAQVTIIPNISENVAFNVLTAAVINGPTIRRIDMSAVELNTVTITLEGNEHVLVVRCINTSGQARSFNVEVIKIAQGNPSINSNVDIPVDPTLTESGKAADAKSVGDALLEIVEELHSYPEIDKTKKIVWFGTSIPAGNYGSLAYPNVIAEKLGITVYNEAVGSSRARASWVEFISEANPIGAGSGYNSLVRAMGYTLAEKQYLINNYNNYKDSFTDNHPETLTNEDILNIKNWSYERKLYRYLTAKQNIYNTVDQNGFIGDVDIYVLDHGYNDVTTRYQSDTTIPAPGTQHEMYYFAGAMNKYIKEIMENNLHAKIIIISHYANTEGLKDAVAVEMQNKIAEYWNIPIINVYKETGWSNVEITINGVTKTVRNAWLPDGVHPASDPTGKAVAKYVNILLPHIIDYLRK